MVVTLIVYAIATAACGFARAAVIQMPPITIGSLTHEFNGTWTWDAFDPLPPDLPGTGGTVTFGAGDTVQVRIQAPPGKCFVVHVDTRSAPGLASRGGALPPPPPPTGDLIASFGWTGSGGQVTTPYDPYFVVLEGYAPGLGGAGGSSLAFARAEGVRASVEYQTYRDFSFTALDVDILVGPGLASAPRTYEDATTYSSPSFGASSPTVDPAFKAMEIVDLVPAAVRSTTWGSLKAAFH